MELAVSTIPTRSPGSVEWLRPVLRAHHVTYGIVHDTGIPKACSTITQLGEGWSSGLNWLDLVVEVDQRKHETLEILHGGRNWGKKLETKIPCRCHVLCIAKIQVPKGFKHFQPRDMLSDNMKLQNTVLWNRDLLEHSSLPKLCQLKLSWLNKHWHIHIVNLLLVLFSI